MELTRKQVLQKMGLFSGALFLEQYGPKAYAATTHEPGVAILCGMDKYPFLRADEADLKGAGSNSVSLIEKGLQKHNFSEIITLHSATKEEFIASIRDKAKPGRPLLVYILGHGSRTVSGEGTLLLADAKDDNPSTCLSRNELRQVLTEVMAKKIPITCFVDACHSWAVAYSLGKGSSRSRSIALGYEQFRTKVIQQRPRNQPPDPHDSILRQPCFMTASSETELAYVAPIKSLKDQMAGVFSYHLSRNLEEASQEEIWDNLLTKTVLNCSEYSKLYSIPKQTPHLSDAFRSLALFQEKKGDIIDLDHLFQVEYPDREVLSVTVKPAKAGVDPVSIAIGEDFDIEINLKNSGYLIAIEKTPGNKYVLQFPISGKVADAKVQASSLMLPTDREKVFYHDEAGVDVIKVFLYPDETGAKTMLAALGKLVGQGINEDQSKHIRMHSRNGNDNVISKSLKTATFRFEVRPKEGSR